MKEKDCTLIDDNDRRTSRWRRLVKVTVTAVAAAVAKTHVPRPI